MGPSTHKGAKKHLSLIIVRETGVKEEGKSPKPWSWDSPSLCSYWPSNEADGGPSWYCTDQGDADGALRAMSVLGIGSKRRAPSAFPGTWTSVCSLQEQRRPALDLRGLLWWGFGMCLPLWFILPPVGFSTCPKGSSCRL